MYMYLITSDNLYFNRISAKTWRRNFIPEKSKESDKIIAVQSMENSHRKFHFRRLLDFISECHNFPEVKNKTQVIFYSN